MFKRTGCTSFVRFQVPKFECVPIPSFQSSLIVLLLCTLGVSIVLDPFSRAHFLPHKSLCEMKTTLCMRTLLSKGTC